MAPSQESSPGWKRAKEMLGTFATSGTAVAISTAATHPVDVVKVQQQMQSVGQRGSSLTMAATTRNLLQEGGARALYRGVEPAVVRALSYGCLRLGLYEPCRDLIAPADKKKVHAGHKLLAGVMSGSFATALSNPLDVAKVRLQMVSEKDVAAAGAKSAAKAGPTGAAAARSSGSMMGQIMEISRQEGVGALWKGVGPSMGRAAALTAAQCAVYDECKQMLKERARIADGLPLHLSASMMAGAVATLASSPFDTVKTRMMAVKKTAAATSAAVSTLPPLFAQSTAPAPSAAAAASQAVSSATLSGSSAFAASPPLAAAHVHPATLNPALAYSTSSAPSARQSAPPLPAARGLPPLGPAVAAGGAPAASSGAPVAYRGSMHCAYSILRTEGVRGLYKGCAANYARLGPMTAITFIVYEQLRAMAGLSSL